MPKLQILNVANMYFITIRENKIINMLVSIVGV